MGHPRRSSATVVGLGTRVGLRDPQPYLGQSYLAGQASWDGKCSYNLSWAEFTPRFQDLLSQSWHAAHVGCGGQIKASNTLDLYLSQLNVPRGMEKVVFLSWWHDFTWKHYWEHKAADFQEDTQFNGLEMHPDTHAHVSMSVWMCHKKSAKYHKNKSSSHLRITERLVINLDYQQI